MNIEKRIKSNIHNSVITASDVSKAAKLIKWSAIGDTSHLEAEILGYLGEMEKYKDIPAAVGDFAGKIRNCMDLLARERETLAVLIEKLSGPETDWEVTLVKKEES